LQEFFDSELLNAQVDAIAEKKKLQIQANADELKALTKNETEKLAIQNKADIDKRAIDKKAQDDKESNRNDDLKQTAAFAEKGLGLIENELKKEADEKQKSYDKDIQQREKNIETQRRLAEKGLDNTLAFEEEQKAKLELQKEQEKQKEIKRQKGLAFIKLLAGYAEKDPNTALTKALRDTILAETIAGAFYEGSEKIKDDLNPTFSTGKDDYVVRVDGNERVLTGEQNKMIGDISNEELAQLAYNHNNGLLDSRLIKMSTMPSDNFAAKMNDSFLLHQMFSVNKELKELQNIIKNKPVSTFELNGYGDFIKSTIENGFTKVTTYKQPKPRI
jgi:hypothetical protein